MPIKYNINKYVKVNSNFVRDVWLKKFINVTHFCTWALYIVIVMNINNLHLSFSKGSWWRGGAWCKGACWGSWCRGAIRLEMAEPTEAATDSWRCPPWRSSSLRQRFSLSGSIPAASASLYTRRWIVMLWMDPGWISRARDYHTLRPGASAHLHRTRRRTL